MTKPTGSLDIGEALQRAYAHWNAGQADQAEIACQQVLAVWPGQADAMHLMGLMAHAYGNFDVAIAHLRQACQAPRAPAIYHSNLAEMCRQRGLLTEAETVGRRAVGLDPNLVEGWNNLGIVLQESGKLLESRQCLERVVARQPNNPQAHNNLGSTFRRLGLVAEAERHWRQAVTLQPDYAEVHSNLATLMTDQGQYDQARASARRAIDLNPRLADAYINLAGAEAAARVWTEALRWLQALLAFAPDHAGALTALVKVYTELDDLAAATQAAERATYLAPESAEAFQALGIVQQTRGQDDAALASFQRAASLPSPKREEILLAEATLHMEFGRTEQAASAYRAVLSEYPRSPGAFFGLASLRKVGQDQELIDTLRACLADRGGTTQADRTQLHFALGNILLQSGDSVEGFQQLDEGNRLKRSTFAYDAQNVRAWMHEIAAVFPDAGPGDDAWTVGCDIEPIFVLGMPRSGTTLIEQILASHPLIQGAGELRFLQKLVDTMGAFPASAASLSAERARELGEAYLARLRGVANGQRYVVDKMPANFLYIGLIRKILPHARIIHARRDPVDTCLSCYMQLFAAEQNFSYDQTELGLFHRDYQALVAHWRPSLAPSHFLEVDYESVIEELEEQARRMIAFVGVPWDDACLAFHQTKRLVRTASVAQVRQPIYRASMGRWRAHAAQLAPLLAALEVDRG